MDPFETARQSFLSKLDSKERKDFDATEPENILSEVKSLEKTHKDKDLTRKLLQKTNPVLRGLEKYGKALDVIANTKPEVLSLLWGSIRIILKLARSYLDIFEKLLGMLQNLSRELELFETYARLYPTSNRLNSGLVDAYEAYLDFCLASKNLLNHDLRSSKFSTINIRDALKPTRKSLKQVFLRSSDCLMRIIDSIKEDADLAEKEAAVEERNRSISQANWEQHRSLFMWLDPVDCRAKYEACVSICEPQTGQWLFQTDEFRDWILSRSGALWLHAKPGAGKTILASTLITHLQQYHQNSDTLIAYYFFDYKDVKTQSPMKLFQNLIAELCRQSEDVLEFMSSLSTKYQEFNSSSSAALMRQIFLDCVIQSRAKQIYILIDALDECAERIPLLNQLHLVINASCQTKLFMTSRSEYDLEKSLKHLPHIALSPADNAADIMLYAEHQLERMITSGELRFRNPVLRDEIRDAIITKADGMFQYAKSQLEGLRDAPSDKWIRNALVDLPLGLDETYIRILERIRTKFPREQHVIRRIFFWLVHSLRPLSGQELAEVAFFSTEDGLLDFESIPISGEVLLQYSGGLYTIVDGKGTIGLAHFSIKTFLLSDRIQQSTVKEYFAEEPSMLPSLTLQCLNYLKLSDFSVGQCFTKKQARTRQETYHFLTYAASQWMLHYKNLPDSVAEKCDNSILDFFFEPLWQQNVLAWQQFVQIGSWNTYLSQDFDPLIAHSIDPIHHMAAHGLWRLTNLFLQNGSNPNAQGGRYGHPVLTAASNYRQFDDGFYNRWDYIFKFLNSNIDVDLDSISNELAEKFSHTYTPDYIEILPKFISMNFWGKANELGTILGGIAIHPSDSQDVVKLLLEYGADPNYNYHFSDVGSGTKKKDRPLQLACGVGNQNIAALLLAQGAHLNFGSTTLGTPLQAAVIGDNPRIFKWLLSKQADVNATGGTFGTPLQAAAWYSRRNMAQILLERGADVNMGGGVFGGPLAAACADGNQHMIDLILQMNPDCNGGEAAVEDDCHLFDPRKRWVLLADKSPLVLACQCGNANLVTRLIDSGAELNLGVASLCQLSHRPDITGGEHPLCVAIRESNWEIVDILLEKGSDPATGNHCAARWVARSGAFELFERLVQSATEPDMSRVCLHAFYACGPEEFAIQHLAYMREKNIRPPEDVRDLLLQHSVRKDSIVQSKYLLELGANPNGGRWNEKVSQEPAADVLPVRCMGLEFYLEQESNLSSAIKSGSMAMVELLIDYGADVNIQDRSYGTPLSAALNVHGDLDKDPLRILQMLLERGADVNKPVLVSGCRCRKVLRKAVEEENLDAVTLLLDSGADLEESCEWHGAVIMEAVRSENAEMIKLLIESGASLEDLDACGHTLLQIAHEERLFEAVEVLSSFGAPLEGSPSKTKAQVEATIERLCTGLLQQHSQDHQELETMKWLTLGRGLWYRGNIEDALIALEQSTFCETKCWMCPSHRSQCFKDDRAVRHICKRPNVLPICKDHCLGNHFDELQQLGRLDTHESIEFPRPVFYKTLEGQVTRNDGTQLSRNEWLRSLQV